MAEGDTAEANGSFVCTYPGCNASFPTERKLISHWGSKHREWKYSGGQMVKEGTVLEDTKKQVNEAGFVVDEQQPLDLMNDLRRILMNNGIRDKRESIVELFEYEDPGNWQRLNEILAQADVTPSKRNMVVDLWRRRMQDLGDAYYDEDEEEEEEGYGGYGGKMRDEKGKKKRSPMSVSPDEMMSWEPKDWMRWATDMQKFALSQKMMMSMMDKVFGSMDMGMGGGGAGGKLPPEIQSKLNRLEQLEEEQKFQKQIEPLLKEIRYLRAESEDKTKKVDPMAEIKEMAVTMKLMETLGAKDQAEILRMQMDERMEKMRIQAQQSSDEQRMKIDAIREQNNQLQFRNIETSMGAKLDMMKQQYELASQSKKEDLMQTITKAKEINEALKALTGDQKTPDDRKMEAIGAIVDNATKTLAPVLQTVAQNLGQPKPGGQQRMGPQMGPPMAPPGMGPMPQQQQQLDVIQIPPMALSPGQRVVADCNQCNSEISVDPTKPVTECNKCHKRYTVQRQAGPIQGPQQAQQQQPISPEMMQQKRGQLLELPRDELDEAARQFGMAPDSYHTKEELVEALLNNRFGGL